MLTRKKMDTKRKPLVDLDGNVPKRRPSRVESIQLRHLSRKVSTSGSECGSKTIRCEAKKVSSYEAACSAPKEHESPNEDEYILSRSAIPLPQDVEDIDQNKASELCPYKREINLYLRLQEGKSIVSNNFLKNKKINAQMRSILVDWLIEVQMYEGLFSESVQLSVTLVDRYLEKRNVDVKNMQLLGIGALFIASKFVERFPPTARRLCYFTDDSYQPFELILMEQNILKEINFLVNLTLPMHFLHRCLDASPDLDRNQLRTVRLFASYMFELHLADISASTIRPSLRAAAAVFLGRTLLCPSKARVTPTFLHHIGYTEKEMVNCVRIYLKLLRTLLVGKSKPMAAQLKFSARKYAEIAKHSGLQSLSDLNSLLQEFSK